MTKTVETLRKNDIRILKLSEMNISKPDLKNIPYTRARAIGDWLKDWIDANRNSEILKGGAVSLPVKRELAYFLGVSAGTVQLALMDLETRGYVICKQCIGTIIITDEIKIPKLYQKHHFSRDYVENKIKKYIIDNNYKAGDEFGSVRTVAKAIERPYPITRFAMLSLVEAGILEHGFNQNWKVKNVDNISYKDLGERKGSIVDELYDELSELIQNNYKSGDKFLTLHEIAGKYNTSVKTAYDACTMLANEGILIIRRGSYGTYVDRLPNSDGVSDTPETSIFAKSNDGKFYFFEKVYNELKHLIHDKYEPGDKLPNMYSLANQFEVSTSVIRLAVQKLAKEGIVLSKRGRFAGTIVLSIPEVEGKSQFKWLSVNPVYVKTYQKVPSRNN